MFDAFKLGGVSVLLGVIGVAQAVYTLVNQAFSGKIGNQRKREYRCRYTLTPEFHDVSHE